jgi:folate-binding protein YgfZ
VTHSARASLLNGVAALSHWGVIQIEGADAAKFIHGQLTNDFALLGQDQARLAAFCNAKGRMQASFIGFKRPDERVLLVCSRDVLASTLKRLAMFVMRAKARLSDATDQFMLYGVAGSAIDSVANPVASTWAKADIGDVSVVTLAPADGVARQLWVAPAGATPPAGALLPLDTWAWGEVRSGIATITAPVFEAFVPQMLNYESVGGVNFKKGCYPGQEVVARSQFRGTLKRRAALVHCDAAMAVGAELFVASDATQPVGLVVSAAAAPEGGCDAIVSAQVAALAQEGLHLGQADGPVLQLLPLPYPLLDDI